MGWAGGCGGLTRRRAGVYIPRAMWILRRLWVVLFALLAVGCGAGGRGSLWKTAVANQAAQLGYRNWIVVAEASFPAQNRSGIRQVAADVEVPEALEQVLTALEMTQHVRPQVYVTRELRSLDEEMVPGIEAHRKRVKEALHGHEATELDQESLMTLLQDANRSFDVLVVRTKTALPYTTVFMELQPGYWDAESESRLRARISRERRERLVGPGA